MHFFIYILNEWNLFHFKTLKNSNMFCQTLIPPIECKYVLEPPNVIWCFGKKACMNKVVWIEFGKSITCPVPGSDIISQLEGVLHFEIIDFVMPWVRTWGEILSSSPNINRNFVCKEKSLSSLFVKRMNAFYISL